MRRYRRQLSLSSAEQVIGISHYRNSIAAPQALDRGNRGGTLIHEASPLSTAVVEAFPSTSEVEIAYQGA